MTLPFGDTGVVTYSFCQLSVHHEVVHVLLCLGELQLPGHHSHHECRAASPLREEGEGVCQNPPHMGRK